MVTDTSTALRRNAPGWQDERGVQYDAGPIRSDHTATDAHGKVRSTSNLFHGRRAVTLTSINRKFAGSAGMRGCDDRTC